MNSLFSIVACGLLLLATLGTAAPTAVPQHPPPYLQGTPLTRRDLSVDQVQRELGALLSEGSLIFGPSNPAWDTATERWNSYAMPDIQIVVQVNQEEDVSTVVKYCNDNSIEFLAYARGHGFTSTLTRFRGIEINLARLNKVTIQTGGKSAVIQGGSYGDLVIGALWDAGYVAATGSSGCVGFAGVGLGGGFGRYQGQYGLVSDNFVNLNVILADGSAIQVNETGSHSDLFWAMKGAGHNFAIVTSVEVRIYPRNIETWHYHNYIWTQGQLETVFETLNRFQGVGQIPPLMGTNFGQFSVEPSTNETDPVINWTFAYAGPAEEAEELLVEFNRIDAIYSSQGDVSYPDLLVAQGTASSSSSCAPAPILGSTANLQTYNVTAQREVYELLRESTKLYPDLTANARVFYEGYSSAATQKIDPASSAYAHRDEYLVVFFTAPVVAGEEDLVRQLSREFRALWNAGQPGRLPTAYVNHAVGDEPVEWMYGHEPWRLERLRALKAKYDPSNRFRFYNPIIRDAGTT
ncbi:hypothetical protein HK57_00392 [Aspergillus ustus]|uniref:FAD-binding PCMH-type domain-containing protein n=1 Tax=Aspergillus ustus TaxID=40382 RepID=A0A0C1E6M6_ASPUT|nr:hypothetical protein HK57_00392 [Aspergillus ustus]